MFKLFCLSMLVFASSGFALEYTSTITTLSAGDGRQCIFFQLEGVTSANNSGSPWFSLPKSHPTFKETYALLMAAKLSGNSIYVNSNGPFETSCGHANSISVIMN